MASVAATYYLPEVATEPSAPPLRQGSGFTDVELFHTLDGGEIEIIGGAPRMGSGYETAAYLSLFGGNEDDSGLPGDGAKQWWGNFAEPVAARRYRSETQWALANLPPTTSNLRRMESAAKNDLAWFVSEELATEVRAAVTMPALNAIAIDVLVVLASGDVVPLMKIRLPWGVTK